MEIVNGRCEFAGGIREAKFGRDGGGIARGCRVGRTNLKSSAGSAGKVHRGRTWRGAVVVEFGERGGEIEFSGDGAKVFDAVLVLVGYYSVSLSEGRLEKEENWVHSSS